MIVIVIWYVVACFGVKKGRETDAENPRDEGEGEGIVSDKGEKTCNEFFMSAWDNIAGFVVTVVGTVLPCKCART